MRIVQFIILVAIIGWCFSTTQVVGNDTRLVQAPADSIIFSNTPNVEGKDFFEVKSEKGNLVSLKIFDRSGTLVYNAEAKKCGWNGRSSSGEKMEGVYFYLVEVIGVSQKITNKGTLTLGRVNSKYEWEK